MLPSNPAETPYRAGLHSVALWFDGRLWPSRLKTLTDASPTRHAQLPSAFPGVFIRALLSNRITSCVTIKRLPIKSGAGQKLYHESMLINRAGQCFGCQTFRCINQIVRISIGPRMESARVSVDEG